MPIPDFFLSLPFLVSLLSLVKPPRCRPSIVFSRSVRGLCRPGLKSRATYGRPCPGLPRKSRMGRPPVARDFNPGRQRPLTEQHWNQGRQETPVRDLLPPLRGSNDPLVQDRPGPFQGELAGGLQQIGQRRG